MYITIYHYGLLAVAISSFLIGFIVYVKAYQDNKKLAFLLVNAATGIWALCLFVFHNSQKPQVFWLVFSHLAAIFVPVAFIHFIFILLDELSQRKRQLILFYLVALILGLFSSTRFSIKGIVYNRMIGYHIVPGPVYKVFTAVFLFLMCYGYFLMIKAMRKSSGFHRNQIRYFLLGSIIGFGGAISTFLPLYRVHIPPLGVLAIPGYGIILAYAMLKRRLMDMRTIISRGLIHLAIPVLVFIFLLLIGFKVITHYYRFTMPFDPKLFFYILGVFFFVLFLLIPTRKWSEQLVEGLIFRKSRNSYEQLRKGSKKLVSILESEKLFNFFLQAVVRAADTNWGALWLFDEKNNDYRLTAKIGDKKGEIWLKKEFPLSKDSFLIKVVKQERRLLLREEFFPLLRDVGGEDIEEKLRMSDFSLIIPLLFENTIKGLLFLGEKNSGDTFSPYELEALTLFSNQAAIAIANAQLFQQVQRMKEYNERIVNNIESGIIVVNREGKVTTFNRKAQEITGLFQDQVLGKTPKVLISPLNDIILRCWRTKEPVSIPELSLENGQNSNLIIGLNTSLIDEEGEKAGVIVILTDLTEVRKLEEKIRQTEKMVSIGSMVSQLAHEIKNPLSSVKTFTELLPEKYQDREFREKFFLVVSKEIKRIDDLLNGMLNLGRTDVTRYKVVSIEQLIKDVVSSLAIQLNSQNIKVNLIYHEKPPPIWAEPQSLKEVFSNILINSIQAMPRGGNITICVHSRKDENTGKKILEVSLADEGGGIPKDYLSRIFDPFFTTKPKGSGLGLYICYQIIQNYGGEIKVKNTDLGAEFTILLPIHEYENSFPTNKGKSEWPIYYSSVMRKEERGS